MSTPEALIMIAIMSACTFLTRVLPFIFFPAGKKIPGFVSWLGQTLPLPIIGMLIVYCLKDLSLTAAPHGLPELLAIAAVIGLYSLKRSPLLAIGGGTALYMLLVF